MLSLSAKASQTSVSTLVLSLDFDGCTDTTKARQNLISHIIMYCLKNPQYDTIAVAIGSLRQSVATDYYNATMHYEHHGNQLLSCSLLLTEFTTALATQLKAALKDKAPKVLNIKMLTSDILNNLPIGTTFNAMQPRDYHQIAQASAPMSMFIQDIYNGCRLIETYSDAAFEKWYMNNNIEDLDESELEAFLSDWQIDSEYFESYVEWRRSRPPVITVTTNSGANQPLLVADRCRIPHQASSVLFNDTSKVFTLYTLHQYLNTHPKLSGPFHMLHFDDKENLLDVIEHFYSSNSMFMAAGVSYQGVLWNSRDSFEPTHIAERPIIHGTGLPNPNFQWDIMRVVASFNDDTNPPWNDLLGRLYYQCYWSHIPQQQQEKGTVKLDTIIEADELDESDDAKENISSAKKMPVNVDITASTVFETANYEMQSTAVIVTRLTAATLNSSTSEALQLKNKTEAARLSAQTESLVINKTTQSPVAQKKSIGTVNHETEASSTQSHSAETPPHLVGLKRPTALRAGTDGDIVLANFLKEYSPSPAVDKKSSFPSCSR
ncbi:MAG: hypothetical protein P1U32_05155 [Legionellaceae bacterium]|nr:hypothetical protein [Legionellaceae bacterium]